MVNDSLEVSPPPRLCITIPHNRAQYLRLAWVVDLADELSMKIDPELSGAKGISRVGQLPNLNACCRFADRSIRNTVRLYSCAQ